MGKARKISDKMATDAKLRNMLLNLPEDHRGYSQAEIARQSGVPQQTISRIESQAIGKLTDYIQQFIEGEGSD